MLRMLFSKLEIHFFYVCVCVQVQLLKKHSYFSDSM